MGMGYGANYADVVDEKFFVEHCPVEFKALKNLIAEHKMNWQDLYDMEMDDFEKDGDAVFKDTYENFQTACEKATGICPHVGYHSSDDDGDRYDDIDGHYWHVEGVWGRTPAGKKYEADIERKFFVTFG